jgi:hypothetical protein
MSKLSFKVAANSEINSFNKKYEKDELYLMFSKNRNSLMVKQNRYHTTLCRKPVLLCFGIIFNISDMMLRNLKIDVVLKAVPLSSGDFL